MNKMITTFKTLFMTLLLLFFEQTFSQDLFQYAQMKNITKVKEYLSNSIEKQDRSYLKKDNHGNSFLHYLFFKKNIEQYTTFDRAILYNFDNENQLKSLLEELLFINRPKFFQDNIFELFLTKNNDKFSPLDFLVILNYKTTYYFIFDQIPEDEYGFDESLLDSKNLSINNTYHESFFQLNQIL